MSIESIESSESKESKESSESSNSSKSSESSKSSASVGPFWSYLSTTGCCGILPVENQNNIQKRWVTAPQSWQSNAESVNFAGRSVKRSQLSWDKMSHVLRNL